ncbi:MAG: type II toxin-antitoxin system HicA family toxin [Thermodesulfobacteriota bacterium]
MSLPKQTTIREIIRKFKALGWEGIFKKKAQRKGSSDHPFMKKGNNLVKIPNPHGQNPIGRDLLRNILFQAGISNKDWNKA